MLLCTHSTRILKIFIIFNHCWVIEGVLVEFVGTNSQSHHLVVLNLIQWVRLVDLFFLLNFLLFSSTHLIASCRILLKMLLISACRREHKKLLRSLMWLEHLDSICLVLHTVFLILIAASWWISLCINFAIDWGVNSSIVVWLLILQVSSWLFNRDILRDNVELLRWILWKPREFSPYTLSEETGEAKKSISEANTPTIFILVAHFDAESE